jgi:hypothetical protein
MTTLQHLINFCNDFNILPEDLSFYGEHDLVYLSYNNMPDVESMDQDALMENYGMHIEDESVAFYT